MKGFSKKKEVKERNLIVSEDYFRGSTTVMLKGGKYYFKGDVEYTSMNNIYNNALLMRNDMEKGKVNFAHKGYNGIPIFKNGYEWDYEEYERINVYKENLFVLTESGGWELVRELDKKPTSKEKLKVLNDKEQALQNVIINTSENLRMDDGELIRVCAFVLNKVKNVRRMIRDKM